MTNAHIARIVAQRASCTLRTVKTISATIAASAFQLRLALSFTIAKSNFASGTQKTAWFMLHRLRHAAETKSFQGPMDGDVEVDEAYLGGKAKNMHQKDLNVPAPTKAAAHAIVRENVSPEARFMTDGSPLYKALGPAMGGEYTNHKVVKHNRGEYVIEGDVHTNSIESVWALFRRQVNGTHHWVSKKHLQSYINEMTWRFNRRDQEEGERVNNLLKYVEGRLTYAELTA